MSDRGMFSQFAPPVQKNIGLIFERTIDET
jgi:hypothetical protein